MGLNIDDMIKGRISETIAEELLRDLGLFVQRLGYENLISVPHQLENFIRSCGGNFSLDKSEDSKIDEAYFKKLPDLVVIDKRGKPYLIEVKFSKKGQLNTKKLSVFDFFPRCYILVINLEVSKDMVFVDSDDLEPVDKDEITELEKTRFHIWLEDEGSKEKNILCRIPLSVWLKDVLEIEGEEVIKRYERIVEKWLSPAKNG